MYYVYAIQSIVDNRIYVGFSDNVDRRLKEHNAGYTQSTKSYRPWILVYKETVESRKIARAREKYLKSGYGKEFIKNKIQNSQVAQR